jgi:16S rRNA (uracil1498-N3)-methyltransferase
MNIVLLFPEEMNRPLSPDDRRYKHIRRVLGFSPGDSLWIGIAGGPRIYAEIECHPKGFIFRPVREEDPPPSFPLTLLTGAVRPVVMKRILKNASMLGLSSVMVCGTERGEASYLQSRLWRGGVQDALVEGAQQGFTTLLPEVTVYTSLAAGINHLKTEGPRIVLDNYGKRVSLGKACSSWNGAPPVLAVGPERGWSEPERKLFSGNGFAAAALGPMVLSTEAACTAGPMVLLSSLEFI